MWVHPNSFCRRWAFKAFRVLRGVPGVPDILNSAEAPNPGLALFSRDIGSAGTTGRSWPCWVTMALASQRPSTCAPVATRGPVETRGLVWLQGGGSSSRASEGVQIVVAMKVRGQEQIATRCCHQCHGFGHHDHNSCQKCSCCCMHSCYHHEPRHCRQYDHEYH